MKASPLIQNQEIRIEDHTRGQEIDPKGLHVHKKMNGFNGKIIFPLNGSGKISVKGNFPKDKINQVLSEIKRVLKKDESKLGIFAEEVANALFVWHKDNITEEKAYKISSILARQLDLPKEPSEVLIRKVGTFIKQYKTVYGVDGTKYFINQTKNAITAGSRIRNPRL
jgi:hypothetical protein